VGQGWQREREREREREGEVLIRNLKTEIELKKGVFLEKPFNTQLKVGK
jgi:hypothetical protein